jgi:hypothetical protein
VAGLDMAICLVILTVAPAITVIGYEVSGHRHQAEALAFEVGVDGQSEVAGSSHPHP